ncbi:MAG: metallophosphoesterase [Candidatus Schekmanbacteria bacterium]|nr:metallophosphoesterase [Candidatus Schekmanbacteria bacterium]
MELGVIADTHDNLEAIQRAVDFFNCREIKTVVHAGDFVAPFALKALAGLTGSLIAVFGNCDGEKLVLSQIAAQLGCCLNRAPYQFELNGRSILLLHQPYELKALIKSQLYDLIIYGHLHKIDSSQQEKTLVFSPGEAGGWLTKRRTVGVIDLDQMSTEIVEI